MMPEPVEQEFDVVDVGALAEELLEELIQAIHEDRGSFPTCLSPPDQRNC